LEVQRGNVLREVKAALIAFSSVPLHVLAARTGKAKGSVALEAKLRRLRISLLAFGALEGHGTIES
jgi:hypothetical protein